jgi:hypothetical protein
VPRRRNAASNDDDDDEEFAFDSSAEKEPKKTASTENCVAAARRRARQLRLERGDIIRNYKPRGSNILFLSINYGRQSDGTVVLNTLNIVGVNGLSASSQAQAHREAVRELPHFISYLRRAMPGFSKAKLARIAPELYIRETRHIHGHYALKVSDIRAEHQFFDRIASASYPTRFASLSQSRSSTHSGPRRYFYTLPLRLPRARAK